MVVVVFWLFCFWLDLFQGLSDCLWAVFGAIYEQTKGGATPKECRSLTGLWWDRTAETREFSEVEGGVGPAFVCLVGAVWFRLFGGGLGDPLVAWCCFCVAGCCLVVWFCGLWSLGCFGWGVGGVGGGFGLWGSHGVSIPRLFFVLPQLGVFFVAPLFCGFELFFFG